MDMAKSINKLDKYYNRLKTGEAEKIKPSHVEKVIAKLKAKKQLLNDEFAAATKESKKERIEQKLLTAEEQIERAEWLLQKITPL